MRPAKTCLNRTQNKALSTNIGDKVAKVSGSADIQLSMTGVGYLCIVFATEVSLWVVISDADCGGSAEDFKNICECTPF